MPDMRTTAPGRHLASCATEDVDAAAVTIDLLGPLRVRAGGHELNLTSRRQRTLMALFAVHANTVLPADQLADQLWDGHPPPGALVTLRSYVFHLRKRLAEHPTASARLITTSSGYGLEVEDDALDVVRFRRLISSGFSHMRAGRPEESALAYGAALQLWRGQPVIELAAHDVATALIAELTELRTSAREGLLRAMVETGRHEEAVPLLEALVRDEPLREPPYELLMLALHRGGRSAEALDVHRRCRALLRDQLGIDPGPGLDQLVGSILNHEPHLDLTPPSPLAGLAVTESSLASLIDTLQQLTLHATILIESLTRRDLVLGPTSLTGRAPTADQPRPKVARTA
ncbi:AfsR/SARP family transcriptional regulator [Nocardioides pelophilus]|uniref:AfsR/SARP family transcriptional regulator n=1 Tax=Nocardioides pelophilus TaxID=2172019 RepID=UPI00160275AD|nr:BTAD domain-containing putative transcriptional regulator [Nocardioides pelophilus]